MTAHQHRVAATATGAQTGKDFGSGKTAKGGVWIRVVGGVANTVVALETSPDNSVFTEMARVTGANRWGYAKLDNQPRAVRANVVALGTGCTHVSAIITWRKVS